MSSSEEALLHVNKGVLTPLDHRSNGSAVGGEDELWLELENRRLRALLARAEVKSAAQDASEELLRVVVEELHHRIKNVLATVGAITRQSLKSSRTNAEASEAITSRLLALGRVHDLLLRTNWDNVALPDLVTTATSSFASETGDLIVIEVDNIYVNAGAALPLAMLLNELCTNAVKYGALSVPAGRARITTTIEATGRLFQLTWTESGGPAVTPPVHVGFGTTLIERSFPSRLGTAARLHFEPEGVVCVVDVPLDTSEEPPKVIHERRQFERV